MEMKPVKQRETFEKRERTEGAAVFMYNSNPGAKEVYVVGEFNNWDPRADRMVKTKGGFRKTLRLTPGEYQYKFIVDGEWHNDPSAVRQVPNRFGTMNSVIHVSETPDR
jgi:1,4-alpha-glucan branching enzyme